MKILSSLFIFLVFSGASFGQLSSDSRCPYNGPQLPASRLSTTVNDFTITTTDGITRNLYNTLDSGKTVFIDLFYTTCTWCQYYSPIIEEIYQNHGAGQGGIEFWGISNNLQDHDDVIDQYRLNYNITNPCAGPQGGGTTAHTVLISGQNFQGWPTYGVVCPDRTMYFDPCYPPVVTGFDPFFEICAAMIGIDDPATVPSATLNIYPNPAVSEISVEVKSGTPGGAHFEIVNTLGKPVYSESGEITAGIRVFTFSVRELPEGIYFIRIQQDGQLPVTRKVCIAR